MTLEPATLAVHLRVSGLLLAAIVLVNLVMPWYLHWREEMALLSLVNRQIVYIHAVFIVLIVAMCSILLLTAGNALLAPGALSRTVLAGLVVFWGLRMVVQWFYYSPEVWKGNRFRTAVHYAFSTAWVYMTVTFAAALWSNLAAYPD